MSTTIKITNRQVKIHTDFFDFMPRYKLEAAEYEAAKITSIDEKPESRFTLNKDKTKQVLRRAGDIGEPLTHWPREPAAGEKVYYQFLDKITDPKTNKFYPARDEEDRRPIKGTGACHVITDLIRLKTVDGEFLLSKGTVIGHDAAGVQVYHWLPWPEMWIKTLFTWDNEYNNNTKQFDKRCLGPSGAETVYMLPFTKENAKQLFEQRANENLNFIVKEEISNEAREVARDVNSQKTFERFLQPFDYLWSGEYIPAPVRAELRQEAVARGYIKGGAGDYQPPSQPSKGKNAYG